MEHKWKRKHWYFLCLWNIFEMKNYKAAGPLMLYVKELECGNMKKNSFIGYINTSKGIMVQCYEIWNVEYFENAVFIHWYTNNECIQMKKKMQYGSLNTTMIMSVKGALDNFSLIPQFFFNEVAIFIPLEVFTYVVTVCLILHAISPWSWRYVNLSWSGHF